MGTQTPQSVTRHLIDPPPFTTCVTETKARLAKAKPLRISARASFAYCSKEQNGQEGPIIELRV